MQNTLGDLNNHLFEQMERLNDDALTKEGLNNEIHRAKAMSQVASQIINNGKLVLDAQKFNDDRNDIDRSTPRMLEG